MDMEGGFELWSCDRAVLCFARREITWECLNKEQLCPPHYHHLGKILSQPLAGAVLSAVQSETCNLSTTSKWPTPTRLSLNPDRIAV